MSTWLVAAQAKAQAVEAKERAAVSVALQASMRDEVLFSPDWDRLYCEACGSALRPSGECSRGCVDLEGMQREDQLEIDLAQAELEAQFDADYCM